MRERSAQDTTSKQMCANGRYFAAQRVKDERRRLEQRRYEEEVNRTHRSLTSP